MPEAFQNWGWFWYLVVFGYGTMVGSFLNVLIYRMPLGLSVSRPPSHCPNCNTLLRWWDNVPLLSFLSLGAKCRYCRIPISWRYFGVELLTGALWVTLFWRLSGDTGVSWVNYVACALFASVLVALIFIDLDHFFVPDELNLVGFVLGLARDLACLAVAWQAGGGYLTETARTFTYFGWLPRALVGAAVYGGLLFLVSFVAFLYYAREENESVGQTARRFFVFEEAEPEAGLSATPPAPMTAADDTAAVTITTTGGGARVYSAPEVSAPALPANGEHQDDEAEDEEPEGEPVRIQFSPAFLAFVAALLLAPALKDWAVLVFGFMMIAFVAMSRRANEPVTSVVGRFFRSNDQAFGPEAVIADAAATPLEEDIQADGAASEEAQRSAELAVEADQFAREAETGRHGGMGLGDVKLALAIGALLGPGPALLSLLVAAGAGAVVGITLILIHGRGMRLGLPFVPFMAFGAIVVLLFGPDLVNWYLRFSGLGAN